MVCALSLYRSLNLVQSVSHSLHETRPEQISLQSLTPVAFSITAHLQHVPSINPLERSESSQMAIPHEELNCNSLSLLITLRFHFISRDSRIALSLYKLDLNKILAEENNRTNREECIRTDEKTA